MREVFLIYYPSYIPEIVKLTSPLALFLSAIFITSRLAQSFQIAVLMTSGVSLYRLLVPYVLVGIIVTGGMWWFNGWIVPNSNQTRLDYEYEYFKDERGRSRSNDLHLQNSPESILITDYFDRRSDTAYRVSLQLFDEENRILRRVDVREMQWVDSLRIWRMFDVTSRDFVQGRLSRQESRVLVDTTLNILPRDLSRRDRDVEFLTISEAKDYLASLQRSGASQTGRPRVEYYSKFAYPLANLILILLSLPVSAIRRRGGQAVQIGIGVAIAFVYLALQKLSEPFGYSGDIDPMVVAFLPHALFGIATTVAIVRSPS